MDLFRYKCSKCENYNLCEKCEEKNENMQNHSHYFIKINNEEKIKDYDNIDISDNFNKKNKKIGNYSYELLNNNLNFYISNNTKYELIQLRLKNNCKLTWPENETKLKCNDKESIIFFDEVILLPLESGIQEFIQLKLKIPKELPMEEDYQVNLNFNVKGKNYGKPIIIHVKIVTEVEAFKKKFNIFALIYFLLNKKKYPLFKLSIITIEDKYKIKILEYRAIFNLDNSFTVQQIIEALERNITWEDAFKSLIN